MVDIPRIHIRGDDEDEKNEEAHPLGIRSLRKSGGSIVVTIPPEVTDLVDMEVGDEVVIHATSDSITLTPLPEQESTTPEE
ncbi:MAG: AbrB/MazE/SpoVT family DNA-binding domain-containing protein [Halobacteriaceae archaeon]